VKASKEVVPAVDSFG